MDPNLHLFLKKPLLPINMEKNLINYYGTLFILLLDIKINVNYQKWITMNFVLKSLIVTSVLLMFTVVGVNLPEDVCLVTNNTPSALLLVLTDGSMMPNLVKVKSSPVCLPMLPPKPLDSLPLNKLNLNNMLEPYYTTKLLLLPPLFWEPKELNTKSLEPIHSLELMYLMTLMKHLPPFSDKSIKLLMLPLLMTNLLTLKLVKDLMSLNPILITDGLNMTNLIPKKD